MRKNIFNFFPKITKKLGFFVFVTSKLPLFFTYQQSFLHLPIRHLVITRFWGKIRQKFRQINYHSIQLSFAQLTVLPNVCEIFVKLPKQN